jgi:hypothetical protein
LSRLDYLEHDGNISFVCALLPRRSCRKNDL